MPSPLSSRDLSIDGALLAAPTIRSHQNQRDARPTRSDSEGIPDARTPGSPDLTRYNRSTSLSGVGWKLIIKLRSIEIFTYRYCVTKRLVLDEDLYANLEWGGGSSTGMGPRPSGSRPRPRPRPELPRPRRDRDVCQTVRDETETRPSSVRDETETRPFSVRDYIETHGLYMLGICTSHCVPKKNPL